MKTFFSLLLLPLFFLTACSNEETSSYRLARDPSWYPLNLMGKGAALLGFSDDLVQEIALEEGINIQQYLSSWASLEDGLRQGRFDAILSSMPPILSNNDLFSFSDPYLILGPVLIVPIQSKITSLDQMEGKEIAIQTDSSNITYLAAYPNILVRPYDNINLALEDLAAGAIDGVFMPSLPAYSYVRDVYSDSLKIATKPIDSEAIRLVTLKDEFTDLIKDFNSGLKTLKENGRYDALIKKWKLE